MTTTPTLDIAVRAYVAECEPLLEDLEDVDRDQLRNDINEIVTEVCGELDGSPMQLIGPPARFVAELRAAAGFGPPPSTDGEEAAPAARRRMWDRVRSLWYHPASLWLRNLMPELRPAWLVGRGVLVAVALARLTGSSPRPSWLLGVIPYWPVFESRLLGIAAIGAGVYLSVEAGRRRLTGGRRVLRGASSVIAIATAFVLISDLRDVAVHDSHPQVVVIDHPTPANPGPGAPGNLVGIGSDVTGQYEVVVHLDHAQAILDELLVNAPPAAIFIEHNGARVNPGTSQAINEMLNTLAEEGFLNGDPNWRQ